MDVHQLYRDAEAQLREAEGVKADAERSIVALKKIMDGLRLLNPEVGQQAAQPGRHIEVTVSDSAGVTDSATAQVVRTGPELREIILGLLRAETRYLSSQEIVDELVDFGILNDDPEAVEATRKLISRMVNEGRLDRERRDGRSFNYGVPGVTPKNAETPALTGVSGVPTPTTDEGSDHADDGNGDHHDHQTGWNDGQGRSAPSVVAG